MSSFTEGIDKIYYDLDNVDDLQHTLHFEGRFKDTGKAVLPWAAAAALGYGIMQYDPQMSDQEKFDNASAIYQFTVVSDQGDPDASAKQFVKYALTLPSKDRKRLKDSLENFKTNIPRHRRERMEQFQQSINYWVNQFNVDRWSAKDDSKKPSVTESTSDAGEYANTWLHDHRDEIETAPENIGIEDIIHRIADDYADAIAEPVSNVDAQEIVNVVEPALTNDYGWILDPDSDILTRYTTVDEEDDDHFYTSPGSSAEPSSAEPRPTGVPRSPFDDTVQLPARVQGQPWVHSDDEFVAFLEWLLKKEWTARQIVDVVAKPYKPYVIEQYKEYLAHASRQENDPLL